MAATCSPSFRASSAHVTATHPAAMTQGISGYLHTLATRRADGCVTELSNEILDVLQAALLSLVQHP